MSHLNRNLSAKVALPLWIFAILEVGCSFVSMAAIAHTFKFDADFVQLLTIIGFLIVVTVVNAIILFAPRVKKDESLDKTNN